MTEDIVPPEIPDVVIPFTDEQLWAIYARIELIDQHFHFGRCCAFQLDQCRYGREYNDLYGLLKVAGVPDHLTPFDRDDFEEWMANREGYDGTAQNAEGTDNAS